MEAQTFDTSLEKYRKPLKVTDYVWKTYSADLAKPLSPELKAELAAREAAAGGPKAVYDAETAANPEFFNPTSESNQMIRANVADLDTAGVQIEMSIVTKLIESGEAKTREFHAGNGEQATTSIHQYLYWLQQRAQDLESDGTYSPEMFK